MDALPMHCFHDEECQDGQICDDDDNHCVAMSAAYAPLMMSSGYARMFVDSVDEIPYGWRLMTAAEADSRSSELSASMGTYDIVNLDGGQIRVSSNGVKVEHWANPIYQELGDVFIVPAASPLSPSSTSIFGDFDVEQSLIVCLVLMNVVLLFYVCPCKSNLAKNKQVYGHVPRSEQEDLCA